MGRPSPWRLRPCMSCQRVQVRNFPDNPFTLTLSLPHSDAGAPFRFLRSFPSFPVSSLFPMLPAVPASTHGNESTFLSRCSTGCQAEEMGFSGYFSFIFLSALEEPTESESKEVVRRAPGKNEGERGTEGKGCNTVTMTMTFIIQVWQKPTARHKSWGKPRLEGKRY
jgi:hypothetical protein